MESFYRNLFGESEQYLFFNEKIIEMIIKKMINEHQDKMYILDLKSLINKIIKQHQILNKEVVHIQKLIIDYNNFKSEIITNELLIQEIKQKYANKTTLKLMNKNNTQRILKLYNDSRELNKICKNLHISLEY